MARLEDERDQSIKRLEDVTSSRLWRWTSPLRTLFDLLGRPKQPVASEERATPNWEYRLESPCEGEVIAGPIVISGWAFHPGGPVTLAALTLDDGEPVELTLGLERPDVAAAYPEFAAASPGFHAVLNARAGAHTLRIRLAAAGVGSLDIECRFEARLASSRDDVTLHPPTAGGALAPGRELAPAILDSLERLTAGLTQPTVVDWTRDGGIEMASATVVRPPSGNTHPLPYVDSSFDIVAVDATSDEGLHEAQRVARIAVVDVSSGNLYDPRSKPSRRIGVPVSIVIPAHGQWQLTRSCLEQVFKTADHEWPLQVVVVDDGSPDDTAAELAAWRAGEPRLDVVHHPTALGFGRACNAGAAAATGEVLIFLNNDTMPEPGWIEALTSALDDQPSAGAIGARLVGTDGRLQEAGCVVFADGSAWNLGRGAAIDDPLFDRVRCVDYCSAAVLATRADVFRRVGGFDERYAPAYYEDTDYCFKLRAAGLETYVEPRATVVHFEGGTAGTDIGEGVKAYQAINRVKFVERWSHALTHQPEPVGEVSRPHLRLLASRGGVSARRVLMVSPTQAEYDLESGSRRAFDVIRLFRRRGWEVTFIAQSDAEQRRHVDRLREMGVEAWAGPDTPARSGRRLADVRVLLRESRFDLAVLHFWHLAETYLPLIRQEAPATPVIVDSVDLHLLRQFRSQFVAGRLLSADDGEAARRELNVYAGADRVVTVSAKEADLVGDLLARPGHATVLPDFEWSMPPTSVGPRAGLVFLANFRHTPNIEGLSWLCRHVLPLLDDEILQRHPVSVVGNALTPDIARRCGADRAGVRLVGWVPDTSPYLSSARVALVPLLSGAGTKRKLLQALAHGTPAVTTSIGAEGIGVDPGRHVLVADTPVAFAEAIASLVTDDAAWQRLSDAGSPFVERHSGLAVADQVLTALLEDVVSLRRTAP